MMNRRKFIALTTGLCSSACFAGSGRYLFNIASQKKRSSWKEIFKSPVKLQLQEFNTGYIKAKSDNFVRPGNEESPFLNLPFVYITAKAYVIKHPRHKYICVDAGFDSSFQTTMHGKVVSEYAKKFMRSVIQKEGQNLSAQLKKKRIKPGLMFFTHLHIDHLSGIVDFEYPMNFYAGSGEIPRYPIAAANGTKPFINRIDYSQGQEIGPFKKCIDLFGDGSMWAIHLPGHTPGHLGYLLNTTGGPVILAGDTGYSRPGLDLLAGTAALAADYNKVRESLKALIAFNKEFENTDIRFNHTVAEL